MTPLDWRQPAANPRPIVHERRGLVPPQEREMP